jgi:four helix bundle protein
MTVRVNLPAGSHADRPVNLVRRGTEQPYAVFGRAVANPADSFIFYFVFSIFYFSVQMNREELRKRTKEFAHRCVKLSIALPDTPLGRHIRMQLIKCSSSVGANYRSACIAQSRVGFTAKLNIVLEETDESCFWLEFVIDEKLLPSRRVIPLLNEGKELTSLFVSSTKTLRSNKLKIENRK